MMFAFKLILYGENKFTPEYNSILSNCAFNTEPTQNTRDYLY